MSARKRVLRVMRRTHVVLTLLLLATTIPAGTLSAQEHPKDASESVAVHPYMDDPLKQLVKSVPELKHMHPSDDQKVLPEILRDTGARVEEFFAGAVDLIADEEIKQERYSAFGSGGVRKPMRDSYLIIRDTETTEPTFKEYRMDDEGRIVDETGLHSGFLITSGFALSAADFSPGYQPDSNFRYLGEQKIDGRDTYVLAFAQKPGEATLTVTMSGPAGTVDLLRQGIAWVDKESFHILRIRTDLLVRQPRVGLDQQTTTVKFSEVKLAGVTTPLWLPSDVSVYMKLGPRSGRPFEEEFRNEHRYKNYRRYRVTTRMLPSAN